MPPPPSATDVNQLYLIIPPPESQFQTYNSKGDPTGNGIQGFHNTGTTNPGPPPIYYWAIIKTDFVNTWSEGPISSLNFVSDGIAPTIAHELTEQFVDRDHRFEEIGDPCECLNQFTYRQWSVQPYWSECDNHCIHGDKPVSLRRFLTAIGFDSQHNGLESLGASTINTDYIALQMQSRESSQNAPSQCYGKSTTLSATPHPNELGYDVDYAGSGFPAGATVQLVLSGLTGRTVPLAVTDATADSKGSFAGSFSFLCSSPSPSLGAVLQAEDPPSHYVVASTSIAFSCTP